MTARHATRAQRSEPAVESERDVDDGSPGGRFVPVAGRRLLLTGAIVILVTVGLLLLGMAARSLSEQRSTGSPVAPPAPGTASASAAGPSPAETSPAAAPSTAKGQHDDGPRRTTVDPVGITIPTIGVKTSVMELGLTAQNTVQVPPYDKADDVGWYKESPTPGAKGPSVLIGHVDAPDGPAVFAKMAQLGSGDRVQVKRSDGTTAVFSIDHVTTFQKTKFPTREVYGDTDQPTLRLITCGGSYNRDEGGYQANTVAFADLVAIKHTQQ